MKLCDQEGSWKTQLYTDSPYNNLQNITYHLLHVFPLISLHELRPTTDAYQWNARDQLE